VSPPLSIRLRTQYLCIFALASVVPVAALGIVELNLVNRVLPAREQEELQDNLHLADLVSSNLRYELNLVLEPVQKATDPAFGLAERQGGDRDDALARLVSTTPLFRHLFVVDPQRRVLASARPSLWRGQQLPAPVFPQRSAQGPVYYSPGFRSIYDAAPLAAIAVAFPTFEKGALVSLLDLSALQSQVEEQSTVHRQVMVVDQTGRPLAHPNLRALGVDLKRLPPVRSVLAGGRGTLRFDDVVAGESVTQLSSYAPIPGTGWGVVVTSARAAVLAGPLASVQGFGVSLAITALAAFGFAYWLSERISGPLSRLSAQMQQMADAPLVATAELPRRVDILELQVLVDSFQAMRTRIVEETAANRRLLDSLAAEKNKLERIIEAIAEGVLVYAADGRLLGANPALQLLIGRTAQSWQDLPLRDVLGNPISAEKSIFARAAAGGVLSALYRLEEAEGPRILQITAAPLDDGAGGRAGGVAIVRDVTAQKETERLREDFVATLTHDLRTPLLAAVQTLNFALEGQYGPLSDDQQAIFLALAESQREVLSLIESLLAIYRYEAGRVQLRPEPTDLAAFVEQCLGDIQPLAAARAQSLTVAQPDSPLPVVAVDRQQLRRVLLNLADNAVKFTPTGGRIRVELHSSGPTVEVAVHDTGRGIPPERRAELFSRFAQGSGYGTGTGLGLYLCRQIVEAHGGRIWAESQPGLGSTFRFTLPVAACTLDPGDTAARSHAQFPDYGKEADPR